MARYPRWAFGSESGITLHPQVRQLLEVQKVDQKFSRLRRALDSIPREREQREGELERIRSIHAERQDEVRQAEVAQSQIELTIKQGDAELEKLNVRLNTVRNNAEYQATLLQMESVKRERGKAEEQGLAMIDRIEELRLKAAESGAKLAEEQAAFEAFCREGDAFVASKQGEADELGAHRAKLLAEVASDVRDLYERIFGARKGAAVVPADGQTCTGCYTKIQPNLLVRLQASTAIVQCDACQRILYLPE
ncbi:MAG: hypothetical protein IPM29_12825 [Planctomycetes bacterium]|nr:hypothetical protein [Planctomycetota bacterium]